MQDNAVTNHPVVVIKSDFDRFEEWQQAFAPFDMELVHWDQRQQHRQRIRFALVWKPEPGSLADLPALEVIFSIGAGIDHLKGDNIVPPAIPVVRMVQNSLTGGMVEYVVMHVLGFHRDLPGYTRDQRKGVWNPRPYQVASKRTVGILGLGVLGKACGRALGQFGFNIIGWSRTEKSIDGIQSYFGDQQLAAFLQRSEFLVCLLPNTPSTSGIINQHNLALLPQSAFFISAGRGTAVVDQDLVAALESGHIAAAAMDVFNQEPLGTDSPYWSMDNVLITPHVASMTEPFDSAGHVAGNIQRYLDGRGLSHLADLDRGY